MHIGLLGFGVVGAGVYDWTRGRADLTVDRVLVRSSKPGIETISTHSIEDILNDPAIDTVVEVMGGLHPAYEYICAAIEAGKKGAAPATTLRFTNEVEEALAQVIDVAGAAIKGRHARWYAIKLLEGEQLTIDALNLPAAALSKIAAIRERLEKRLA